jgi:hypothetical protein
LHDLSKFLPCEWVPYTHYFYGNLPAWDDVKRVSCTYPYRKTKEGNSERFDLAWLHHQHCNPHHWQWWLLREDSGATVPQPMSEPFIKEMVVDWVGAGKAQGKPDTRQWYAKNSPKMVLHPETSKVVETLLAQLAEGGIIP